MTPSLIRTLALLALAVAPSRVDAQAPENCGPRPASLDLYVAAARSGTGPALGTASSPYPTIAQAVQEARAGDHIWIGPGTYRETVQPRCPGRVGHPITFERWPVGDGDVVVSGSDVMSAATWVPDGNRYTWTWQAEPSWPVNAAGYFSFRNPYAGWSVPESVKLATRAELIVAQDPASNGEGRPLRPVTRLSALRPGTFYVETAGVCDYDLTDGNGYIATPACKPERLYARFWADQPPAQAEPEIGVREVLFLGYGNAANPAEGGHYALSDLRFRYANNRVQYAAVCLNAHLSAADCGSYGAGSVLTGVEAAYNNSVGVSLSGRANGFIGSTSRDNGQQGVLGLCDGCVLENGYVYGNNWKGYDVGWEAGGIKMLFTNDTLFRRMTISYNDGPGLWLDTDCERNVIEGNVLVSNLRDGIFLEAQANHTLVQHNIVTGTRRQAYQFGAGLQLSASTANYLYHNTLFGNEAAGILVQWDGRGPNAGNYFANNLLAFSGSDDLWPVPVSSTRELHYTDVKDPGACTAPTATTYFRGNVVYDHAASPDEYADPATSHATYLYGLYSLSGTPCAPEVLTNSLAYMEALFGETRNSAFTRAEADAAGFVIPAVIPEANGGGANPQWGLLERPATVSTATLPTCDVLRNAACAVNPYSYAGAYPAARYDSWLEDPLPSGTDETAGPDGGAPAAVFPNPVSRMLHVDVPASAGLTTVRVEDALGRTVLTQAVKAGPMVLDVSGLSPGLYLVVLEGDRAPDRPQAFRVTVVR